MCKYVYSETVDGLSKKNIAKPQPNLDNFLKYFDSALALLACQYI